MKHVITYTAAGLLGLGIGFAIGMLLASLLSPPRFPWTVIL